MSDLAAEITMVMNFFGMVDQCQNLGRSGYSGEMVLGGMKLIEIAMVKALTNHESMKLFNELENIYFPTRNE